jgi:TonB family protein
MKKILFLSICCALTNTVIVVAQPTKTSGKLPLSKSDSLDTASKGHSSQSLPMTGATSSKSQVEKAPTSFEEDDFDEKELHELEISIAKAKATLGMRNASISSTKSIGSKPKEVIAAPVVNKPVEENKNTPLVFQPTSISGMKLAAGMVNHDYKEVALSEEEKKMYNAGGLTVNAIDDIDRDSIYVSPQVAPSFPGGLEAMQSYFSKNLKLPDAVKGQEIKGRVFIRFVVRKDGHLDKVHLIKGPNDDCNAEAIRVIKSMPAWAPATNQNGDIVSAYHVLPISFSSKR